MFTGKAAGGLIQACPPRLTQTAGTAIVALIPPGPRLGQGVKPKTKITVTKVIYTTGGATAHIIYLQRPFNYTTFSADAAAAQAVVNIAADPGLYATAANWLYDATPNSTPAVANNAIAANDYVVYQCADGTWVADIVSSVSTLAITLTANVPTGGVKQGGLFYFYGISTDKDPNTGYIHPQTQIPVSSTQNAVWADTDGIVQALHPGDPILFYSGNAANAGLLEGISGYYALSP